MEATGRQLTPADLSDIDEAAAQITIQDDRYPPALAALSSR